MPETDKLRDIFTLQSELNDAIFQKQDIRGPDGKVLTMTAIRAAVENGALGPNGLPNQWLRNYLRALEGESAELGEELRDVARWRGLAGVRVDDRGDLAADLRASLGD